MNTSQKQLLSKAFIFRESEDGKLIFHGDFDGYYQDQEDPWDQSGQSDPEGYYHFSRQRVASWMTQLGGKRNLEVGCGLGYSTQILSQSTNLNIDGIDISAIAVEKANRLFPAIQFQVANICSVDLKLSTTYETVILNQLLWYILDDLDQVMTNCYQLLDEGGHLIVSNAFARDQRYGKEIIDGFAGACRYFSDNSEQFSLIHAQYNDDGQRNTDGIFVLKKR